MMVPEAMEVEGTLRGEREKSEPSPTGNTTVLRDRARKQGRGAFRKDGQQCGGQVG